MLWTPDTTGGDDYQAGPAGETVREMISRAERDGFTKGLAYRIARATHGDDYSVCVLCGWAWAGMNRCVNPGCGGFCTWGKAHHAEPTSWIRTPGGYRPRMPGEPKRTQGRRPEDEGAGGHAGPVAARGVTFEHG